MKRKSYSRSARLLNRWHCRIWFLAVLCTPLLSQSQDQAIIGGGILKYGGAPIDLTGIHLAEASADLRIHSVSPSGSLVVSGTFTNGVCTVLTGDEVTGPWRPAKNTFTTNIETSLHITPGPSNSFHQALAWDLSDGRVGFTNLTRVYGLLTTIAGAGGPQEVNNWRPEYEGAKATEVVLSGPHMTMADRAGGLYIADKDAHGIRKIRLDGTLVTVAGTSERGDGLDEATSGTEVALNDPNGLWVRGDGTLFILDTGNGKVRRLGTNGIMQTLFTVPGGISVGRGLWVSDDETEAYLCSLTVVKRWTATGGVTDFATDFSQLGNLVVDPSGQVVVTDRGTHRVYRLDSQGNRTVIAGNGLTSGGGDGQLAIDTALNEVRAVWLLPSGAFFVATHRGSQVWYVDTAGYIHLFLNGNRNGAHAGDGTWFYNLTEARVSECRAITMDYDGNLLITENDVGYVRKVEFLPFQP